MTAASCSEPRPVMAFPSLQNTILTATDGLMRNPKVSIIIAAYNAGPTIEKALCSVEKQSFQDWECLIIDGMSQDDTIQKVKYFADKDNRSFFIEYLYNQSR